MSFKNRLGSGSSESRAISQASVLGALAVLLGAIACDGDGSRICTTQYVYGITVEVEGGADSDQGGAGAGGASQGAMCEASVEIRDGDYTEELECFADGDDCSCYGAGERPGNYEVTVTLRGESESQTARVNAGDCHVEPVTLRFPSD